MTTAEIEARRAALRHELAEGSGPPGSLRRELAELNTPLRVIRRHAEPRGPRVPLIGLVSR